MILFGENFRSSMVIHGHAGSPHGGAIFGHAAALWGRAKTSLKVFSRLLSWNDGKPGVTANSKRLMMNTRLLI
jgi:hypothetical protein